MKRLVSAVLAVTVILTGCSYDWKMAFLISDEKKARMVDEMVSRLEEKYDDVVQGGTRDATSDELREFFG